MNVLVARNQLLNSLNGFNHISQTENFLLLEDVFSDAYLVDFDFPWGLSIFRPLLFLIYIYIYIVTPLADGNCIFFFSKKPHQKVWPSLKLELTFSSNLDWGSYIISIAETASKKTGALIRSIKFLSPEVSLCLYNSTIRPCMEYCCQVWAGTPSSYLELLDKLQKRICRTIGPSFAASLEPLAIIKMWSP